MNKLKLITVMLAVAALVQTGDACTVVIAGKKATVDGSVLTRIPIAVPIAVYSSPRTKISQRDDGACLLWHLDA